MISLHLVSIYMKNERGVSCFSSHQLDLNGKVYLTRMVFVSYRKRFFDLSVISLDKGQGIGITQKAREQISFVLPLIRIRLFNFFVFCIGIDQKVILRLSDAE